MSDLQSPQPARTDGAGQLAHLRGLLDVAEAMREQGGLEPVLEAIACAVAMSLGWRVVVVNLHRPAFDDFEVRVVYGGSAAGRERLMGTTNSRAAWEAMLHPRFERQGAYVVPHQDHDWSQAAMVSWVPEDVGAPWNGPDAWHLEDGLFVPLRGAGDTLLGVLSLDEPVSGRLPTDAELDVLAAVAAHAALAIEHAQAAEEMNRHRLAVEHLLRVSARLTGGSSAQDTLADVCLAIRDALGFEKVCALLSEGPADVLVPRAWVGWDDEEAARMPRTPLATMAGLLDPALETEGCALLERARAHELAPEAQKTIYASATDGRGPLAWHGHWLLVALHDRDGAVIGMIWADDPGDHLLPTTERLQALRAFANQAAAAVEATRHLDDMRHLAEHDPLTGLRNRRDFEQRIEDARARGPMALIVCDLDHFKRINDSLGHEGGDAVLRRFAAVLRRTMRQQDTPTRLGGEEFAIVLPGTDADGALAAAERLRRSVRDAFAEFELPVSVSVGVVASTDEIDSAPELMRAANRALYAAKRLGRDRCVFYEHATIALLDDLRGAGGDQLAAAMLLAETLDLRDAGTARHSQTVGHLCESIAAELGWEAERIERVHAAGVLHDIGKLGIADAVLHKPGALDDREWQEVRRHPEMGARILEHANLPDIAAWVLHHHERIDGRGYPGGLAGTAIPEESRILSVADAFEAMTADRPYRTALPRAAAEAELREGADTQFDPEVVDALLRVLARDADRQIA
ncbi:MAG: diguanylate cyclase [Solirubrobacteraceae bacterium]